MAKYAAYFEADMASDFRWFMIRFLPYYRGAQRGDDNLRLDGYTQPPYVFDRDPRKDTRVLDAMSAANVRFDRVWRIKPGAAEARAVRRSVRETIDPFYVVQGLYHDGYIAEEFGSDDEGEAIQGATKMANAPWFEGDYVRVITRDGDLVWDSREGALDESRRRPLQASRGAQADQHAADELALYIDNTSDLSINGPSGQGKSVLMNALRRWRKGTYDPALAVKLFEHLAESGAKRYTKEFGGNWHEMFTPATRREAARQLEESFRVAAEGGEYDHVNTGRRS